MKPVVFHLRGTDDGLFSFLQAIPIPLRSSFVSSFNDLLLGRGKET